MKTNITTIFETMCYFQLHVIVGSPGSRLRDPLAGMTVFVGFGEREPKDCEFPPMY